jgi:peptidoglycan/LPS O-acetylase OafA/YrhL
VAVIGDRLSDRNNSLNFLRLVLALAVVVSHALQLGNFGFVGLHTTGLGEIGVYGFFGISGYLIAASATHNGTGRYLWQRFLRIFPGFWVCLLMMAFVFGLVAWVSQSHPRCGALCYFGLANGPMSYVSRDSLLNMRQTFVTPTNGVGWWQMSNGSLWTLYYEFICYLILGALAMLGLLRRRVVVLIMTAVLWIVVVKIATTPSLRGEFSVLGHSAWMEFFRLTIIFMVGALIYLYRDHIPDSGWLALACGAAFAASLWLPGAQPEFMVTPSDLLTPLIAYPVLWLGIHVPLRIGSKNDYSYGVYVYAYPVTVLLALWGVAAWGVVAFVGLSIVATVPFAAASWWLVERNALKLKTMRVPTTRPPHPKAGALP